MWASLACRNAWYVLLEYDILFLVAISPQNDRHRERAVRDPTCVPDFQRTEDSENLRAGHTHCSIRQEVSFLLEHVLHHVSLCIFRTRTNNLAGDRNRNEDLIAKSEEHREDSTCVYVCPPSGPDLRDSSIRVETIRNTRGRFTDTWGHAAARWSLGRLSKYCYLRSNITVI